MDMMEKENGSILIGVGKNKRPVIPVKYNYNL